MRWEWIMMYLGVDIGGTHTDIVAYSDETEEISTVKTESTPDAFRRGAINGIRDLADQRGQSLENLLSEDVILLSHGTTVGTNALLTREGVDTGLMTTAGFEDNYDMARMNRGETTDLSQTKRPEVLLSREDAVGVEERIDSEGEVVISLSEDEVREAAKYLVEERDVDAIAVSLLWSLVNSEHEELARRVIKDEYPGVFVSVGSSVAPLMGEFERTSTVVMNAYVSPIVKEYVAELEEELRSQGFSSTLYIMSSEGGISTPELIKDEGVQTLYSGPAAGVVGAERLISQTKKVSDLITFDMGGTSTDVGLIEGREVQTKQEERIDRLPLSKVMVDVNAVGAGGGSIAWIDDDVLRVGPQSAGADPGPACYGISEEPTVTDADLVLGYLPPERYLGGEIEIDPARAEDAIQTEISDPLGMDLYEGAKGIYRIVTSVMADAIREITVNRGYDPRNFTLTAFGGAAGVHITTVANELDMSRIFIPPAATSFSALGLLTAELSSTNSKTEQVRIDNVDDLSSEVLEKLNHIVTEMDEQVQSELTEQGFDADQIEITRTVNLGYQNQNLEVEVPLPEPPFNVDDVEKVLSQFTERFNRIYGEGSGYPAAGIILKTFKSEATVVDIPHPDFSETNSADSTVSPDEAKTGSRRAYESRTDSFVEMDVYEGTELTPNTAVSGPSIIEYPGTTLVLHAGDRATVDGLGGLDISISEENQ